jgi:hypothetical protein
MQPEHIQFFFEDMAVGYFDGQASSESGKYPYMPYRGPGHYRLTEALGLHGPQQCYYVLEGQKFHFEVVALAERMIVVSRGSSL